MNTGWAEALLQNEKRSIIAIEGRAAAGKSTLAKLLQERYQAAVIHMDDFYLPMELRTKERYQEPGGNVHYERFNEEVAESLRQGGAFRYQRFDCSKMALDTWMEVADASLIVIEGAYCLHPKLDIDYTMKIFMDVAPNIQRERIRMRNGEERLEQFLTRWIPYEERYFAEYQIKEQCDLLLHM
ncbi:MAG: uridine kinase [Lachnospiraceae bacterium]|nr:uridine kinase [Lachnospiraceae bacterium]